MIDIGVAPSMEVGMAQYDSYMMNGLMTPTYPAEARRSARRSAHA